jgi:hypothetical protein
MFLLLTLAGIVTLNRLQAAAAVSATNDAREVARLLGLLAMPGTNKFSESAQKIVAKLHQTQGRDVVLLNSDQIVVADSLPSRVGRPLTEDPADQVGMTIRTGRCAPSSRSAKITLREPSASWCRSNVNQER